MADPKKKAPSTEDKLEKEANERLRDARRWKELWVLDFKECYFFAAPHRQRQISSQTQPSTQRMLDAPELQTSLAFLLCQDFITEVVNTYMPESQRWCERKGGMDLPDGVWDQIKNDVRTADAKIFDAMKVSNLYPEITKAFYPDLAIGTIGMWIDRPHPSRPISVKAIPLREIEVNLGPEGEIDDRFAVRFTRNAYVRSLLPGITLPDKVARVVDKKPSDRTEIRWSFWRLWDKTDDEYWQHVIMVGDDRVHDAVLKGEGSCPLIIGRFNPSADWPWGLGPMIQGLPDFRQIDELEARKIEGVSRAINPPIGYPDDSFAAVEQGIEDGMAYPLRPGSEKAIVSLYPPINIDAAVYQHQEMEHRLRKLFFVDFPEQTGDTPPTAAQWLDELARAQRRIGTPGLPFWREVAAGIFLRFKYLLEASGAIMPIRVDGRTVGLLPYNPAQRAAEQQEIALAAQFIQLGGQAFPEEFKVAVDGDGTLQAIADRMRVTGERGLIKFRDEKGKTAIVNTLAKLALARHAPEGATPEGAGPPAAV